jgi:hypothetical protein
VFELFFASVLNIVFLLLIALLLWPLGRTMLAFRLAKGYWLFWVVIVVATVVLVLIQRIFRVDMDSHYDAYVISCLAVSSFLQAGWSAFAALTIQSFVAGAPVWVVVVLYLFGLLSCQIAYYVVAAYYGGHFYRLINLPVAHVSFIVFSVWPASGRVLFGWFFDLF